jgi:hypothetical protein
MSGFRMMCFAAQYVKSFWYQRVSVGMGTYNVRVRKSLIKNCHEETALKVKT